MSESNHDVNEATMRSPHTPDDASDPGGGRRLVVMAVGSLVAMLVLWIAVPITAAAESPEDSPPISVTVSEEPGVCSTQESFCERLLDWTGNEAFAETTAWLVGTPLRIIAIIGMALLLNRLARRRHSPHRRSNCHDGRARSVHLGPDGRTLDATSGRGERLAPQ